jgi:hypothetical protein
VAAGEKEEARVGGGGCGFSRKALPSSLIKIWGGIFLFLQQRALRERERLKFMGC